MKGILVNNEYCTGCESCETTCKVSKNLGEGVFGIKVFQTGPYEYEDQPKGPERWEMTMSPMLTKACDLCEERTTDGKMPLCVQHCQAYCMYYGEIEDLVKKMDDGTRWVLLTPRA